MSDYLLLTDRKQCPKCGKYRVPPYPPGLCRNCGMNLFRSMDGFIQFEIDTGWREYWVWTGKDEGWKHRTQIFNPSPIKRDYNLPNMPDNYGTQEYINQKLENSRIELKKHLSERKKKP